MAIALITHDLGVVAGLCDRVMVMYAGRVVETAPADRAVRRPAAPLHAGPAALDAAARRAASAPSLPTIPGQPPNLQALPEGCVFADRCPYVFDRCRARAPDAARRPGPAASRPATWSACP